MSTVGELIDAPRPRTGPVETGITTAASARARASALRPVSMSLTVSTADRTMRTSVTPKRPAAYRQRCRAPAETRIRIRTTASRREDGTIGAINGFATKTAAADHATTLESEQRQGRFIDPAAGKITLAEWSQDWLAALDVAIRTEDFYRSLLRRHILPRWGDHGLADISGIKAAVWAKELRAKGYSPRHRRGDPEAAVAAAGRRRRGTAHPGQPHPRPPTRPPPRRTPPRTRLGHPRRGARDRRQRRPAPGGGPDAASPDRDRRLDRGPLGRAHRLQRHHTHLDGADVPGAS